jgi:hypothetical protein
MFKRLSHATSRPVEDDQKARLIPVPARKESLPALGVLEDVLYSGTSIPFTDRILVDRDLFQDALDQLHDELPTSIARADAILRDEENIRARAQAEAQRMLARAESQVAALLSEKGLLREAEATRERILREASTEGKEIMDSSKRYVDGLLAKLERGTEEVLVEVRKAASTVRAQR